MTDDLPQLVQRLRDLAARYDMSHTERYEVDSEAFYAETGYIAPGKDVPMAMGGQNEAERRAAHEAWITARNRQQQQTLRDAATALDTLTRALAAQQKHVDACEATIRAHAAAAAIFQPGGRFHKRASLVLGRSAVADGIAWLVKELDAAEATPTAAAREARAETWASAIGAVEALGESGFFNYAKEQLKAARTGQP